MTLPWNLPFDLGGTYQPDGIRYPATKITAAGWWMLATGRRPLMQLKAYDGSVTWQLLGGLAPPYNDPTAPEAAELKTLKGLIPPWKHIQQKGATQDGVTHIDALYDPCEVEMVVECVGKGWASKSKVVRDLIASIDAKEQSELGFFDKANGYWWSNVRWYQGAPSDALDVVHNGQPLSLRLQADDALWRTYDHTSSFGFAYATMAEEFDVDYEDDLGPLWPQYYTGSGEGYAYTHGGMAKWSDDPDRFFLTGTRRVVAGPFRNYETSTDDFAVHVVFDNTPEYSPGKGAANDIWARMGKKHDGTWDGNGIRARVGWGYVKISVFRDYVETVLKQEFELWPPIVNERWTLWCEGRTFSLRRTNGSGEHTVLSVTETGTNSRKGADYRNVGFGMQAGGALITQATPARVRSVWTTSLVEGVMLFQQIEDFDFTTTTGLGENWPLRYSGVNDAYVKANGSAAVWIDNAGTDTQEVVNGPYRNPATGATFVTATDNQVVGMRFVRMQEWSFPSGAGNDLWARMGFNPDGSWNGNGIRLRLENNIMKLSRFNNFVQTVMKTQVFLVPPLPKDKWILIAGYEGNPRLFKVVRNGVTVLSHKEVGTGSALGAAFRGVGFGMQAGGALITQATPGFIGGVWAGDNSTVSQEGFLERVNIGDQPMYDDYTLFGPGMFKIYDGPGSTDFVQFGPLLENQIVFLRTDPRSNTTLVQDLTVVPPSPQALSGFQVAIKRLVSFFTGRSALSNQVLNNFGIKTPQGNLYKYLDGRFSDNSAIPPKSPGNKAKPYYVKVAIDDGNADSSIIACGTPKRRYPL
ncbi:hypothetical protein H7J86_24605 [Mycobacterium hackensackense]|uniref:DUF7257 domain-containing protein n=1 Tax=Mycobacterium hackensackense TaxID=228909 RepID=UPI002265C0AF|nr:hypothetical protein [Mycobacterium hackensackense]MCV7255349.1 hypothetical protein [Mycobacterium hackensackense]